LTKKFSESAPKALPTLSSSDGLAPFLLNILSLHHTNVKLSPTLPTSVVATALQTLSCLTDSNPTFALPFLHLDLDALLSIAQSIASAKEGRNSSKQLLRVLAISCLLNIIHCTSMPVPAAMLPFDDPKEAKRLQKRHTRLADQLKHALDFKALETLVQGLQVDLNSLADEEEIQNLQIQLEVLGQFALSMDGLATLEEEDEWRGIEAEGDDSAEDVSDVDDAMDDAVLEQLDVDMNGDGDQEPEDAEPGSMIPTSMGSVILDSNLVPTLLAFGAPSTIVPAINGQASIISTAQNGTKSTADQLRDLCRLRAMEALNNLLFTCTRAHLASRPGSNSTFLPAPVLQSTWEALFQLLATHANSHLADYRLAVLGCVLACAQIAQNSLAIGSGETPFLLQVVGSAEEDADVRARAISVLALLGARESVSVPENEVGRRILHGTSLKHRPQTIGTTLITPFKAPTADSLKKEMTVLTQALDSLIDLYSDETRDFDRVFREQNFQHKLKKVIPTFKVAVSVHWSRMHSFKVSPGQSHRQAKASRATLQSRCCPDQPNCLHQVPRHASSLNTSHEVPTSFHDAAEPP
jgi:hypothetical protein